MRQWNIETKYQGQKELQVMLWPYQRQAYRFAIDWFVADEQLEAITVTDCRGWANTLTLVRPYDDGEGLALLHTL